VDLTIFYWVQISKFNSNPHLGWSDIINNSQVVKTAKKSSYFKIPHHGSTNGFHQGIWDHLLLDKPIGSITPWNRSTKLPNKKMLKKYSSLTCELYITSPAYNKKSKPKARDRKTEKVIDTFNDTVEEMRFDYGVISSRLNFNDEESNWKTTVNSSAFKYN